VSILDRLRLNRHLDDAAFAAIWTDRSLSGVQTSHPHLNACAVCRSRFSAFTVWLEELRTEATSEADEAFPAERLAAQHAQIFRRLEAAERPARVIAFPKFSRPLAARSSSRASRWVAAAAAAGLIVGVGVGQLMDLRPSLSNRVPAAQTRLADARRSPDRPEAGIRTVSTAVGDEKFLSELDASLSRPAVPELRALDEFTPRAGEQPR
jgi:hypothetical protein